MELVKLEAKSQKLADLKHWDMFEYKNLIHIVGYDYDEDKKIDRKYLALNEGKFYETTIPDTEFVQLVKIENLTFSTRRKYAIVAERNTIYPTDDAVSVIADLPLYCMFVINQNDPSKLYFKYTHGLKFFWIFFLQKGVWIQDDEFYTNNSHESELIHVVPDKLSYSMITRALN